MLLDGMVTRRGSRDVVPVHLVNRARPEPRSLTVLPVLKTVSDPNAQFWPKLFS